jgi:hypothetical protein
MKSPLSHLSSNLSLEWHFEVFCVLQKCIQAMSKIIFSMIWKKRNEEVRKVVNMLHCLMWQGGLFTRENSLGLPCFALIYSLPRYIPSFCVQIMQKCQEFTLALFLHQWLGAQCAGPPSFFKMPLLMECSSLYTTPLSRKVISCTAQYTCSI